MLACWKCWSSNDLTMLLYIVLFEYMYILFNVDIFERRLHLPPFRCGTSEVEFIFYEIKFNAHIVY